MKKVFSMLAISTVLTLSAVAPGTTLGQPLEIAEQDAPNVFDKKVIKKIDVERIYNHIDHLSQEPRVAGTEQEDQAVEYIKDQFNSYGYETDIQPFTFLGYTAPDTVGLSAAGYEEELDPSFFTYSVSGNVSGEVVHAGLGTEDELQEIDLTGKIALIERGDITFGEKVINASEKGALGVIIYNHSEGVLNGTLGGADDAYVPAVSLSKAEGEALAAYVAANPSSVVTMDIEGAVTGEHTSHNVIATKAPTNQRKSTNEIIVVGSHHDSVAGAPGANDDASGVSVTLELARVLKNMPGDTEIRFVTFGAEELGLIGSSHYVDSLSDDEINRTIANFNLDMVGSRDAGDLVMATLDGEPNLVTELAQASSKKLNGEPTPVGQGGRSDHVPFAEAGIAAALFIHSPSEPWYHTPEDSLDKISKEKLQDVAEIVGTAIYDRARFDNQNPKSNKGPKTKAKPDLYHEQLVR